MEDINKIDFTCFKWLNEPVKWTIQNNTLEATTKEKSDFWQGTHYNFYYNTGHLYGIDLKSDFTFEICVEADFTTLYDQAGVMIYVDEKHWLKAGIEFNDGEPMIGSVLTNVRSDWATGLYPFNPHKFYMRLSKVGKVVCVKYSSDNKKWILLRLCEMPESECYFVGPFCCTPQRQGLNVKFSDMVLKEPAADILHCN